MYSYRHYLDSTVCTVTGSIWRVPYVKLPAVYGEYFMYSYRQELDSNVCIFTGSIWRVP